MILLLLAALAPQDFAITQDRLDALHKEARPVVERAVGRAFRKPVSLRISTEAEVARILAEELVPQLRAQLPGQADGEYRSAARSMADAYARHLVGKYQPSEHRIHVIAANFKRLAEEFKKPRVNSPEYLRAVVLHELVHALDEQEFRAASRAGEVTSTDELLILNALLEGHAQHVLRKVLEAEKCVELFQEFEEITTAAPPGASEGEKALYQQLSAHVRFGYVEGRKFFDGLAELGKKTYVADVFRTPPASKDVILYPARFYEPKKERVARDLAAVWDGLLKEHEGWQSQRVKSGEFELRTAFGDFVDAKDLDAILPRTVGGGTLVLAEAGRVRAFAVIQMESPEAATKLAELLGRLSRSKETRLKEGAIRVTKCERRALPLKSKLSNECTRMTLDAQGETVHVADAVAVRGDLVIEALFSGDPPKDEEVATWVDRVEGLIKEGK